MDPLHRQGFHSLRAGGLNWDSLPLRLFVSGNAKCWNPADIDFDRDAEDWRGLAGAERTALAYLAAMFVAGEEALAGHARSFIAAMSGEDRFGDVMYLTQSGFEEARHAEAFRRWLDAVELAGDLQRHVLDNPGYRTLFCEALPEAMRALDDDPTPANQVRASVTYHHIIEGTLALTGHLAWSRLCRLRGILPGIQQLLRHVGDDQRRHMAWGTFTCRRHVAADDANWHVVLRRTAELLPYALSAIQWVHEQFDEVPFELNVHRLVGYAADRAQRRLGAIEAARGLPVDQIDVDRAPEQLEERFFAEDAATLAVTVPR
ncbi:R2-like ligand-binding oxidase [Gandjariella thermophila]|uniref:R2-like ligand binding oxidase n=1 Tax=Gandjariella thermophila TaxID=1931992 RepID=A0A4D4J515_9PSEU|nr:R2-like ligand-binding oxidase [Gandjariella thermophila]GDY30182.1 ribonucleoside-diphosphate reductase subunit beta [Gandjariella thermophila]